jgi:hypothetical protein
MISINEVRNVVLQLLNKNNRGYITPEEFNNYCKMAQLSIFEELFDDYNKNINKQNRRLTNSEYANLPKNIREQIDIFAEYSTESNFTYNTVTNVWSFTGTDFYRTENISLVTKANSVKKDVEEVNKSELNNLLNSNIIAPTTTYPAYVKIGNVYRLFPLVSTLDYYLEMFYIRKPKDPKWTYVNVQGNPIYNPSATDKQDIELHQGLFDRLVVKVLLYCGISIREDQVIQIANNEDMKNEQQKNQ